MFTPLHAEIALGMNYHHETAATIHGRLTPGLGLTLDDLTRELQAMASSGAIFYKEKNLKERAYALVPFVVGMYEFQLGRLTQDFLKNTKQYFSEKYALEFLLPHHPQFRVIPVEKSVNAKSNIATYESLTQLIEQTTDPIAVVPCICRTAQELAGNSCQKTKRREVCLTFRDIARFAVNENLGREISKEEALAIARESEKEGLILEASGEQEIQVICACCSCCCGVVNVLNKIKRPVDFISSNFFAQINREACTFCGACARKCNLNAITCDHKKREITLKLARCVGCGVCAAACKAGAITMQDKPQKVIPPVDMHEMYEKNMMHKKGKLRRAVTAVKILAGIRQ
jgi:ferredoxin